MQDKFLDRVAQKLFQPVTLARLFFVLLTTWCGMMLAEPNEQVEFMKVVLFQRQLFSVIALTAALIFMIFEYATDVISSHKILMAAIGLLAGLVFAHLAADTVPKNLIHPENSQMVCNLMFGYFGVVLAMKHADRFHLSRLKFFLSQSHERPKVLDSSVIIDGRVRELISLNVIAGPILVPNFVLTEIQAIADSSDPNRKARGRRGLEMLEGLRESCKALELVDKDYPTVPEVDQKLISMSREMDAELITNDYNLQKIAEFHQITVININELANALRPTVYIGEVFDLMVVREGKEAGQGVGYLEDGTMVVVDDSDRYVGQEVRVIVSSILQTSTGRMVFAKLRDHANGNFNH